VWLYKTNLTILIKNTERVAFCFEDDTNRLSTKRDIELNVVLKLEELTRVEPSRAIHNSPQYWNLCLLQLPFVGLWQKPISRKKVVQPKYGKNENNLTSCMVISDKKVTTFSATDTTRPVSSACWPAITLT